MKNRKRLVSVLSGIMAAVMLLTLLMSVLPTRANAASSSEIRKQINQLKKEKQELQDKIADVQEQYEENENEIADIIAKKNVIDQEIQILSEQITNMNDQLSAYNLLIADKQDELDNAEDLYAQLNEENKVRVRTMEEEGQLSYWEVLFKANSFSDLLDRLNMVEEISAADNRRLQQLSDAADAVEVAQEDLQSEKAEMEVTKKELDDAQEEMNVKRQEADDLLQELLSKADDLEALEAEFQALDEEFLKEIATKEQEYSAAKQAEWEAYMATYVPPTTAAAGSSMDKFKGIMVVSSGIEFADYEVAKEGILHQLDLCRQGEITQQELESARSYLISALRTGNDSPGRLDDYAIGQAVAGLSGSMEDLAAQVQAVTMDQVVEAANTLTLDTVYFLKGVEA